MTIRSAHLGIAVVAVATGAAACAAQTGESIGSSSSDVVSCSAGETVEGIDVSYYQGSIDWNAVKASGRAFAFARVSDGDNFVDPDFASYWSGMKAAGIIRGVYQFFRPEQDGTSQASLLLSHVTLEKGDLPPVLDVEVTDGTSSATIANGIAAWVSRIKSATGRTPIVYTAPGFWDGVSGASADGTALWVANWQVSCPTLPGSWSSWRFWQYSDSGAVSGISGGVDLDRFDGTLAELQAFAGSSGGGTKAPPDAVASAVAANQDGRLEAFVRWASGSVQHDWQSSAGQHFVGWSDLGGEVTADPVALRNADGRLEVFARGTDGALWHDWQKSPDGSWSGWSSLGGSLAGAVTGLVNGDGRLEIFAGGSDGDGYHVWQTTAGGSWSGWSSLGMKVAGDIGVAVNADGRAEIFAQGTDGAVWHDWWTTPRASDGWHGWASLGGGAASTPVVARNADGRLEVFVRGTDDGVHHAWQTTAGGSWSSWSSMGGNYAGDIAVAVNEDGRLEVFGIGGNDRAAWHAWQTTAGGSWSAFSNLGGSLGAPLSVGVNQDGRLEVFARGSDGAYWHDWQTTAGGSWNGFASLGGSVSM